MKTKNAVEIVYFTIVTFIFVFGAVIVFTIITSSKLEKKIFIGAVIVIIALSMTAQAQAGEWFKYFEVYAGVDYYNKKSPLCEDRPQTNVTYDDKATSNMGFVGNIYSGWVDIGLKGTHFSCVWNRDDHTVNMAGFVVSKRWSR